MISPDVLATVELLGALTYAQLRAFDVTAASLRFAPDVRDAHRVAEFAVAEHGRYRRLRERLAELTDLSEPPMDRQKGRIDAFFDGLPVGDWLSACTFFAIGLPMAADFGRAVAPALDDETADVVVGALAGREEFEAFAVERIQRSVSDDAELRDRTRRLAAEVTGSAFTEFQGAITDTDALLVLLEQLEETGDDVLRTTAVSLLEQHRRRMAAIGLDTPE